ncbi:MAG: hypothetical protein MPN21_17040 [Thermoanaerobaculia bacterium]|nr:hypothetical protein [Thermoanaerobaculia bacterium]
MHSPADSSPVLDASSSGGPATLDGLYPLGELLAQRPDVSVRHFDRDRGDMPEPYRSLLVHDQDMTSTLEKHHREPLELCRVESRRSAGALWRQVLLVGRYSGEIREAGAIRIDLRHFDAAARWEVLEGQKPLGAILADHRITYVSRPRAFFAFDATRQTDRLLGLSARGQTLYGRQNRLSTSAGVLADVVEILPPVER